MKSRPLEHLTAASKLYPGAWRQVNTFREGKGKDLPDWPSWCFLPMAAWYAIVSEGGDMPVSQIGDVALLSAIGTWRYTQGVYVFDPDTLAAISSTIVSGELPTDVLLRLPEWSLYIPTPGLTWAESELHGFWVHLERDIKTNRNELRFLLDADHALIPQIMHLGKWTVTEAMDRAISEANLQSMTHKLDAPNLPPELTEFTASEIQPLLSLVLYLCSDAPEIDGQMTPIGKPKKPIPKKKKGIFRLLPAKKIRVWHVGQELGKTLRSANLGGENRTTTPHIRKAHWHGFWSGARDSKREFNYKWLPPILVKGKIKEKSVE